MRAAPEREFMPGIELRTFSIKPSQVYYIAWTMCSIKYLAYYGSWFSKLSIYISLSRAAATSHNYSDMVFKVQSADSGPPATFGVLPRLGIDLFIDSLTFHLIAENTHILTV
jgi:hypothetical protein